MPLALSLAIVTLLATTVAAATYYVTPSGDDANSGSDTAPWRTIQHAANNAAPGDTIQVAPGDYQGSIVSQTSGTAATRIRFVSTQSWGTRIASANPVVWLNYGNYVDIVGFDVSGTGAAYIGILNLASNVLILGNHVHHIPAPGGGENGGAGIDNGDHTPSDSDIIGNVVHDIGDYPTPCKGGARDLSLQHPGPHLE